MKLLKFVIASIIIALLFTCQIESNTDVDSKFVFLNYNDGNSLSGTEDYNRQTVGGTNNTGTDIWIEYPDSTETDGSSYINNSENIDKPNIVAPAQMILTHKQWENGEVSYTEYHFGTSLAAPLVTGAVSLLLEKEEELKFQTECVYALLMATSNNYLMDEVNQSWNGDIGDKTGAGVLQIEDLLSNSSNYHSALYSHSRSTPLTHIIDIDNQYNDNVYLSVSLYWLQNTSQNSNISNFDLKVYYIDSNDNEVIIGESISTTNNFELVVSNTSYDGPVIIEVTGTNLVGNLSENIGIAWKITQE